MIRSAVLTYKSLRSLRTVKRLWRWQLKRCNPPRGCAPIHQDALLQLVMEVFVMEMIEQVCRAGSRSLNCAICGEIASKACSFNAKIAVFTFAGFPVVWTMPWSFLEFVIRSMPRMLGFYHDSAMNPHIVPKLAVCCLSTICTFVL